MRITWSLPVRGERLGSSRGDIVRAAALIDALRSLGHEVEVVQDAERRSAGLAIGGYRNVVRRMLPARLARIVRDAGRVLHANGHARHVIDAARRAQADAIVETQVHFARSGAIAARATGLPLVLDDCSPSSEELVLGPGLPRLAALVMRSQARAARALLVPSEALRAALVREGLPAEKLRVVPNGVDLDAHDRARAHRDAVRRDLGLGARVAVAFVGSFQPWHQAELLPQALALTGRDDLALVLAGDGPGRAACIERAQAAPSLQVVDLGSVPPAQVPQILGACDAGALPGTNDYGQPMKLLEYAAARLPCVAPDLPPVREMLSEGRTGLLFPPGNAAALAACLAQLAGDPALRQRLGQAAFDELAAPASWAARARLLVAAIEG